MENGLNGPNALVPVVLQQPKDLEFVIVHHLLTVERCAKDPSKKSKTVIYQIAQVSVTSYYSHLIFEFGQ